MEAHVASVYFKCFRRFRGMLQLFYMDVAKVDRGIAYVVSVSKAYCKCFIGLFKMFHLFQTYVANVLI